MIRLFQFAPAFGLPNASPFCMKLETWLRLAGLRYELDNSGNVFKAPQGKLPYIDDDGEIVADTSFVIEYLKRRYGDPLDAALARRGILRELRGQGMGRHTAEQIHAIGCRDITAIADFLDHKPFMRGDAPTSLDATAFAFLANLLWATLDTPVRRHASSRPTLEACCRRMKARTFG